MPDASGDPLVAERHLRAITVRQPWAWAIIYLHVARAVSSEQQVYILHSKACLTIRPDLRECPWSLALDEGIDLDEWVEDVPLTVGITDGRLRPLPEQQHDAPADNGD